MTTPWPDNRPDLLPRGTRIRGTYEVVGVLGEGGFGVVYEAIQHPIERGVAVKVLTQHGPKLSERFLQEAKAAAKIAHPNVVTLFDFGLLESGAPFMVMELLQGNDLQDEIEGHGPLHAVRALRLFSACLDALGVVHGLGITHRDLKPSNLFVQHPRTAREQLRILDFGIARVEEGGDGGGGAPSGVKAKLTGTGQAVGTPQYLAPEYITRQQVSPALDVYQMGLILIEALTGELAVRGSTWWECVQAHTTGALEVPGWLREHPGLGPLIARATALEPGARFADGAAFKAALDAVAAAHTTWPDPPRGGVGEGRALGAASRPGVAGTPATPAHVPLGYLGTDPALSASPVPVVAQGAASGLGFAATVEAPVSVPPGVVEPPVARTSGERAATVLEAEASVPPGGRAAAGAEVAPVGERGAAAPVVAAPSVATTRGVAAASPGKKRSWPAALLVGGGVAGVVLGVTGCALLAILGSLVEEEAELAWEEGEEALGGGGAGAGASATTIPEDMVEIAPGSFVMGSPSEELKRLPDEQPHAVRLTRPFLLQRTELTRGQWRALIPTTPIPRPDLNDDAMPVERLSWFDAATYANARSDAEGLERCYTLSGCEGTVTVDLRCDVVRFKGLGCGGYRLPTEAEWEYAARAGTTTTFPTGGITHAEKTPLDPNADALGWYGGNARGVPRPVGRKAVNAFGLHDMQGNVWEWCTDWYGPYSTQRTTDPIGPGNGRDRVARGGAAFLGAHFLRSARRGHYAPDAHTDGIGMRLARTWR